MKITIAYNGSACLYSKYNGGLFEYKGILALKDEYGIDGNSYLLESGEIFWAEAKTARERDMLIIQPCKMQ